MRRMLYKYLNRQIITIFQQKNQHTKIYNKICFIMKKYLNQILTIIYKSAYNLIGCLCIKFAHRFNFNFLIIHFITFHLHIRHIILNLVLIQGTVVGESLVFCNINEPIFTINLKRLKLINPLSNLKFAFCFHKK